MNFVLNIRTYFMNFTLVHIIMKWKNTHHGILFNFFWCVSHLNAATEKPEPSNRNISYDYEAVTETKLLRSRDFGLFGIN